MLGITVLMEIYLILLRIYYCHQQEPVMILILGNIGHRLLLMKMRLIILILVEFDVRIVQKNCLFVALKIILYEN